MPSSPEGSDYTPSDGGSLGGSYDSQDSESDGAARSDGEQSLVNVTGKSKTESSKLSPLKAHQGSPSPPSTAATTAKKDALTPPTDKKASLLADLRKSMARIGHSSDSDEERHSSDGATPVSPVSSPAPSPPSHIAPAAPVHRQSPVAPVPPMVSSIPAGEKGLPKKPCGKAKAKPKVLAGQKWRGWSSTFPHWYKYPLPKQTPVGPDREDWTPHYPRLLSSNRDWWQNGRALDGMYRAETVPGRMLSPGGDWGRAGYRMGEVIANQAAPPADLSREHRASTPRRSPSGSPTTCSQAVRQRLQWNMHEPTMPSAAAMSRGCAGPGPGGYPSPGQSRSLTPR